MYLISAYFDEKSNRILSRYMKQIAKKTGNEFMEKNHVPPHLTISALEAKGEQVLLPIFESLEGKKDTLIRICEQKDSIRKETEKVFCSKIFFASVGMFLPYVIYIAPVFNQYLFGLSEWVYQNICNIPEVQISRFYQPLQWLPHITLGKTLTKEEMRIAFEVMQHEFSPFEGEIISLGLAKVNPHEDLHNCSLENFYEQKAEKW